MPMRAEEVAKVLGMKKMKKTGRPRRRCFAASPVRRARRTERLPDGGTVVEGRVEMGLTLGDGGSVDCRVSDEGNAFTTSLRRLGTVRFEEGS